MYVMHIGVFDTGLGGHIIAKYFQADFPKCTIVLATDTQHFPYGSRSQKEIVELTDSAIQPLLKSCDIIVLACNTATAAAIDILRIRYPNTSFIGVEPMIKPAATASKSGIIAICATPATLKSERYLKLKQKYAANFTVLEPNCSSWAENIENGVEFENEVRKTINKLCNEGADVILLSCTHYHTIKDFINLTAGDRATVLEPSEALSRRVRKLIEIRQL